MYSHSLILWKLSAMGAILRLITGCSFTRKKVRRLLAVGASRPRSDGPGHSRTFPAANQLAVGLISSLRQPLVQQMFPIPIRLIPLTWETGQACETDNWTFPRLEFSGAHSGPAPELGSSMISAPPLLCVRSHRRKACARRQRPRAVPFPSYRRAGSVAGSCARHIRAYLASTGRTLPAFDVLHK